MYMCCASITIIRVQDCFYIAKVKPRERAPHFLPLPWDTIGFSGFMNLIILGTYLKRVIIACLLNNCLALFSVMFSSF